MMFFVYGVVYTGHIFGFEQILQYYRHVFSPSVISIFYVSMSLCHIYTLDIYMEVII